jgi:polyhydroxyalkanoate synthesis repressor PhaR
MADSQETPKKLKIKRYSNRRFYDATRSCHLTFGDMHDLICSGHELSIEDSSTGEDITNLVLTQIILDRDPPKLGIFPANILHELIRTQQQLLGGVVEQYFRQVVETQRASQERWSTFLKNTLGFNPLQAMNPLEWTRAIMGPSRAERAPEATGRGGAEEAPPPASDQRDAELGELRRQIEALREQVESSKPAERKKRAR